MAAMLFVLSGLFVFIALATLLERVIPDRVFDEIFRLLGVKEDL